MMDDDKFLLQFWGKTPKPGDPPERYHPAIYHMLDVAFVAEALLRDGAPRLRRALLHAWRGCDEDSLIAWLPFLIATHDLGKIAAAFQGQAKREDTLQQRNRLIDAGVQFAAGTVELYHAEISAVWLHDYLIRREPATSERLMWVLRDAMGGHHGRFTQARMHDIRKRLLVSERSEGRWPAWRNTTYMLLRETLAPASELASLGTPRDLRPATAALTGFIVWCDWMGSNERDFPASPELSIDQYLIEGRARATAALNLHQLRANRPSPSYTSFGTLFPKPPRPLQALIDQLTAEDLVGPLLAVIEAPAGEGKTEASLALTCRIAHYSHIDEIFFALPTMATGNQMFLRLDHFYRTQYGDAGTVRLTHSQSVALEADLRARVRLSGDTDAADRDGRSADAAIEWYVGSKKAMLAPFGVGTVDQIELAGLDVRHYPLRLFGLAGKVVVIDEIHAYDAYMNVILAHTLTWLASMGCSVILLSATLPAERHRALADAFLSGLGRTTPPDLPAESPYPALSLYRADGQHRETCAVFRGEQPFTIRFATQRDTNADAAYLLELVRDGGAVARLCNRVDDAQAIYQALVTQLPPDCRVLLHARFPLKDRQKHEQRIEDLVGKTTTRIATQRLIIVGTQVLEQSLDYDVDVMVSDFAPIDLLLQRAGRLHRHNREHRRPDRHTHPVLEVVFPIDYGGLPNWERWAAIYDAYVLWRSWETLRVNMINGAREIVLPRDYRPLIEAVYGEDIADRTGASHAAAVAAARLRFERGIGEQEAKARRPLTPDALSRNAITEAATHTFISDEDGAAANGQLAKTRLGDRITVVPVYRAGNALALDIDGTWSLSRDIPPDLDHQKEILARAVPISDRRIIAAYRDEQRVRELRWPWPEREIPALLRSIAPLPLDRAHTAHCFEGRSVRLDAELGLVIEKLKSGRGLVIEEEL
jgi:CRISPR-associated endonuclease/helicase Cas3